MLELMFLTIAQSLYLQPLSLSNAFTGLAAFHSVCGKYQLYLPGEMGTGVPQVPDVTFALRRRASKNFWLPLYPKLSLAYRFPIKVISDFVPTLNFF